MGVNEYVSLTNSPSLKSPIAKGFYGTKEQYKTLRDRLKKWGMREHAVKGDGSCQFRALAHQLFGSQRLHKEVRTAVAKQLSRNRSEYEAWCEGGYDEYVAKMARSDTWGDHLTLKAASDYYGVSIYVLTSYPEEANAVIEVKPETPKATYSGNVWLCFWAEIHYNALTHTDRGIQAVTSARMSNLDPILEISETERLTPGPSPTAPDPKNTGLGEIEPRP